jgi:hypothetical protein
MGAGNGGRVVWAIQFIRRRIIKHQKGGILKNPKAACRVFEGNLKELAAGLVEEGDFPMLWP